MSNIYDQRPWLKSYDPGVSPELDIPDEPVTEGFRRMAAKFPDRAAYHFFGRSMSFARLMDAADLFAAGLAANGVMPGDVVAVNLPNLPQYLIAQLGAAFMGCPVAGVSPLMSADEMAHVLNDSGAAALVTLDPIFEHRLAQVAHDLPELKLVIPTGIPDYLPPLKAFFAKLFKKVPTGKVFPLEGKTVITFKRFMATGWGTPPKVELTPESVYLLQYTGGTTGLPKGAMLTHRNMMSQVTMWRDWFHMDFGVDTACSGYPFFHAGGQLALAAAMWHGCTQILVPDPRNTPYIVAQMKAYNPTFINNVPSLFLLLMDTPGFRELDFSGLRFATSAAAPFPVEPMRELEAIIGGERVVEIYGLTETSPIITVNPTRGKKKIGSVGIPAPSTWVRLVDIADGETIAPQGERGELIVRGPQVMAGYWNQPEETERALREHDGEIWFHTGDVAVMDPEGYFEIVDRIKDMIIVSGYKVFPREVEEKLYQHPAIEFCAVVGVPNPERPGSELVKLFVQKSKTAAGRDDEELAEELKNFCREKMGPQKVPKIIQFLEQIPLTAAGKVDRKPLKQL